MHNRGPDVYSQTLKDSSDMIYTGRTSSGSSAMVAAPNSSELERVKLFCPSKMMLINADHFFWSLHLYSLIS